MGIKKKIIILQVESWGGRVAISTFTDFVSLSVKQAKKFQKELADAIVKSESGEVNG